MAQRQKKKDDWMDRVCGECRYYNGIECGADEENPFDTYDWETACSGFKPRDGLVKKDGKIQLKDTIRRTAENARYLKIKVKRKLKKTFSIVGKKKRMIESLKEMNKDLLERLDASEREKDKMQRRIRRMGSLTCGSIDTPPHIQKIEVKPEPYGLYTSIDLGEKEVDKELIDAVKRDLARKAADALIEGNMMQIQIKGQNMSDPLSMFTTVAAKLYVVPWEQMAIFKREVIDVFVNTGHDFVKAMESMTPIQRAAFMTGDWEEYKNGEKPADSAGSSAGPEQV